MGIARVVSCVVVILSLPLLSVAAIAQSVIRIEEDWVLQVVEPDDKLDAPQITTAIMPLGPNSDALFYLDLNHGSEPDYSTGGMQLRIESDGQVLASKRLSAGTKLCHASETIKWTQIAIQDGNQIKLGIVNGQSQSWGKFGGVDTHISTTISNGSLGDYRYSDSLANSGAVYAGNRVASLTLVRVRVITSLGQVFEVSVNQSPL